MLVFIYFHTSFSLFIFYHDPRTVREVVDLKDSKIQKKAMVEEMATLDKHEAWNLVDVLFGRKLIGIKWVFERKLNVEGKVEKYKASLVAKGYS